MMGIHHEKKYDFTNAEQGKFYIPIEELDIPIYLDEEVKIIFFDNTLFSFLGL